MAAHDQLKAISAGISAASIELAGLERVVRKSMAPTPYELDEVAYWPIPARLMADLATCNDVAIDYATAQRMLNRFWIERAQHHTPDMAVFNIEPGELVRFALQQRDALNATWQCATVTVELNTGLVALFVMTARPAGVDKKITSHLWLTTPEGVELWKAYGEIDRRDGAIDLLKHEATEANYVKTVQVDKTPLKMAGDLLWQLTCRDDLPPGLSARDIKDCQFDLDQAFNRVDAVIHGRHPGEMAVQATVTEWRQTT